MIPAITPLYSLSWAQCVVERLYQKHTRATELLLDYLEIRLSDLALFLARNDPIYAILRETIKKASYRQTAWKFKPSDAEIICYIGLTLKQCTNERLRKRLYNLGRCVTIKEQGSRGGLADS